MHLTKERNSEVRKLFLSSFICVLLAGLVVETGGSLFVFTGSQLIASTTVALVAAALQVGRFLFFSGLHNSSLRDAFTTGELTIVASVIVYTFTTPIGLVKVVFTGIVSGIIMYAYRDFVEQYKLLKDSKNES